MKKIMMSAALLAILASGCQNEAIIEAGSVEQSGELFTLEVNKEIESRTVLSDLQTHWSNGDQLYVCGRQGQVHGVLTLKNGAGTSNGTFEGYIKGGSANDLQHVVFPAPENNKIDMSNRGDGLNIPMIGEMSGGAITGGLKNVGAVVTFDVEDGHGYPAKAFDQNNTNLAAGSYTFNPQSGTLIYNADDRQNKLVGTYVNGGKAYLPVATSLNAISSTSAATSISDVTVEVSVEGFPVTLGGITVESGEIYGDATDNTENTDALDVKFINNWNELKDAFTNGGIYKLADNYPENDLNIAESLTVGSETTLSLDLNGKALNGKNVDDFVMIRNRGELQLVNGTVTDEGATKAISVLNNFGKTWLNCSLISNSSNAINGKDTCEVHINGGFYISGNPKGQALRMNAWNTSDYEGPWKLYINGGTFEAKFAGLFMLDMAEGGIAEIRNAIFKGDENVTDKIVPGGGICTGADILFEGVNNVTIENCTLQTKTIHSMTTDKSVINRTEFETTGNVYEQLFGTMNEKY